MQSNWYVFTGAPRSGVDAIMDELEKLDYKVVREAARLFIDEEIAKGKTIEVIRADEGDFQRKILAKKIEVEQSLPRKFTRLLVRAVPDSIAYYMVAGINPDEARAVCQSGIYRKVFYFEALEYIRDYARTETEQQRQELERLLFDSYQSLGYEVIRVPVLPIPERVRFILDHMYSCSEAKRDIDLFFDSKSKDEAGEAMCRVLEHLHVAVARGEPCVDCESYYFERRARRLGAFST